MGFPSPVDELSLHERILSLDPVAPEDAFNLFMDPLVEVLRRDLGCDEDDAHDSAIDALFAYLDQASRYDPGRGRLGTYLIQIAKRRAIDRLRERSARTGRERDFGAFVELRAPAPKEEMEQAAEARELWQKVKDVVEDESDCRALHLLLAGERSTEALANALGLSAPPTPELRRNVKRHRDRLLKILRRLGEKMRDDDA